MQRLESHVVCGKRLPPNQGPPIFRWPQESWTAWVLTRWPFARMGRLSESVQAHKDTKIYDLDHHHARWMSEFFSTAHWSTSHFSRHLSSNPVMSSPLGRCSPVFEASQGIKAKISKQPSGTRHLKHHQGGLEKWCGCRMAWNFSWDRMKIQIMPMSAFFRGFRAKNASDKVGDEMKKWSAHSYDPTDVFIQTLMMGVSGNKALLQHTPPHSAHSFAIVASQAATTVFIAQRTICWMPPFSSSSSCRRLSGSLSWMWIFLIRLAHVTHAYHNHNQYIYIYIIKGSLDAKVPSYEVLKCLTVQ